MTAQTLGGPWEPCVADARGALLLRLDRQPRATVTPDPARPPQPVAGEHFISCGGRPLGRILDVDPGRGLTGEIAGATMSYELLLQGDSTRLLLKIVMARGRAIAPLVSVGDLVMARRQLLNLQHLAEG